MRKIIPFLFYLCFGSLMFSQTIDRNNPPKKIPSNLTNRAGAFIDVNTPQYPASSYNIAQIIKDVLITGGNVNCVAPNVSNVTVSPNLPASNVSRTWGYFHKGTTNFPFTDGIVLVSGTASSAGNSFISETLSGQTGIVGDTDLANALGVPNSNITDVTSIEFDFVPSSSQVTFRYLFASEEYFGSFPCSYSDGFALLIKPVGGATYTNLAVLPNSTTPVSVTNIRPFNSSCTSPAAVNVQYFGGMNTANVETNFYGRTVPLTATANVTPGQAYHFKMVLSDFLDKSYDSAVFLEGGSFNIGLNIVDNSQNPLPATYNICAGECKVINSSVNLPGAVYTWSLNGTVIPGANGPSYTACAAGNYTLSVVLPNAPCPISANVTIIANGPLVANDATLTKCTVNQSPIWDLTAAQPQITTLPGSTFSYYATEADALAGNTNTIATPTAYTSTGGVVYVLVKNGVCKDIAALTLDYKVKPTPIITSTGQRICGNESITLTSNYPTGNVWSNGANGQSITVTTPGTYSLTVNNGNCASDPVSITIPGGPLPVISLTGSTMYNGEAIFCEGSSVTLTANAPGTGMGYTWSSGQNGPNITVTQAGVYTVTATTAYGCSATKSITVIQDPKVTANIATPGSISCGTPLLTLNAQASILQANSTIVWTASNGGTIVSGAGSLTPVVSSGGTYTLTITGVVCSDTKSVTVVANNTTPTVTLIATKLKICQGESTTLTASGASTYEWSNITTNGNTQIVSPLTTTTYTVYGTGPNGCRNNTPTTITIEVVPTITSNLKGGQICENDQITLDAGAGPNYTYLWSTGATTQTIIANTVGTYTVTISNGSCSKTFTAEVTPAIIPVITDIQYTVGTITITAIAPSGGIIEYSINGGNTWQTSNVFNNTQNNTEYTVFVRLKGTNCTGNTTLYTFVMPNAITPNGDGINDVVDFTKISLYPDFQAGIYDRYGRELFLASKTNLIFNGKYQNRPLHTATYWYKLQYRNTINKALIKNEGWILLKNRE